MYRYLDRRVTDLAEPQRLLLAAMRLWVESARTGRCSCAMLAKGFAQRGIGPAARDFSIAMAALDSDALGKLRFGCRHSAIVGEDEARLLALFDAAIAGHPQRVRRIATVLVRDDATGPLATAVEWIAVHLSNGTYMEQDQ